MDQNSAGQFGPAQMFCGNIRFSRWVIPVQLAKESGPNCVFEAKGLVWVDSLFIFHFLCDTPLSRLVLHAFMMPIQTVLGVLGLIFQSLSGGSSTRNQNLVAACVCHSVAWPAFCCLCQEEHWPTMYGYVVVPPGRPEPTKPPDDHFKYLKSRKAIATWEELTRKKESAKWVELDKFRFLSRNYKREITSEDEAKYQAMRADLIRAVQTSPHLQGVTFLYESLGAQVCLLAHHFPSLPKGQRTLAPAPSPELSPLSGLLTFLGVGGTPATEKAFTPATKTAAKPAHSLFHLPTDVMYRILDFAYFSFAELAALHHMAPGNILMLLQPDQPRPFTKRPLCLPKKLRDFQRIGWQDRAHGAGDDPLHQVADRLMDTLTRLGPALQETQLYALHLRLNVNAQSTRAVLPASTATLQHAKSRASLAGKAAKSRAGTPAKAERVEAAEEKPDMSPAFQCLKLGFALIIMPEIPESEPGGRKNSKSFRGSIAADIAKVSPPSCWLSAFISDQGALRPKYQVWGARVPLQARFRVVSVSRTHGTPMLVDGPSY
eukprot:g15234.t1